MRITMRRAALAVVGTMTAVVGTIGLVQVLPAAADDADTPPSIVETYDYPGAASIPNIKLIRGDGHIMAVACNQGKTDIEVYSFLVADPFCFDVKGTSGYLALELEQAYGVRNYNQFTVDAKVSIEGAAPKTVTVPVDDWAGVGVGANEGQAVLLELRF